MIVSQLRRAYTLLTKQFPHAGEHHFEPSRLGRLREKESMLRSIRSGRLRVQFQTHNRRARRMHFQIELKELEQCRRILQRQRWTNGALMLCLGI
jgi:hypothetical protein